MGAGVGGGSGSRLMEVRQWRLDDRGGMLIGRLGVNGDCDPYGH